ncbi:hypothetical protein EA473_06715 [Natrarchaeobius chitinivorans]|uniref:Uncharacterized protein n=1 Tax=Natrarchaeobius chitinivorans TaxID=1679083 RepID=A0A3N6PES2_NATCH|nr:hypothetical protein EA473_06715 [Natrarchaeobius chitinivorans]
MGTFALAGCVNNESRYWDSPPSFDDDGLESVTDRTVPDRPTVIPVAIADDRRRAIGGRVDELLEPIPEPLTVDTLPNGAIREEITSEREAARSCVGQMEDTTTTLDTATVAADAREHAGRAAGVWAAVSTAHSLEDVTLSESEVSSEMSQLADDLPGDAASPLEGSVVYGPIESWLDTARRSTLVGRSSIGNRANPVREGSAVGDVERIRAEIEVGEHLRDRYVEHLERPRAIEGDLETALEEFAPHVRDRFLEFHGEEDVERPWMAPSLDDVLGSDRPRDHPGVRLFSTEMYDLFDEIRFEPIAWPEMTVDHPAHRLRTTHWALAGLETLERIGERVDDGDELFPGDADELRRNRNAAIDAVDDLLGSGAPLERWSARRLVDRFGDPDELVASGVDADPREIADANGSYVWIATMADTATEASSLVESLLP